MRFNQLLLILRAHKNILLLTVAITLLIALTVSLFLPKRYIATVSVVTDSKNADPLTGLTLSSQVISQLIPGYMATQVDIISSHAVALRVVDQLHLTDIAQVKEQYIEATNEEGTIRDWLADALLKSLDVKPSRESSIIHINYTSEEPQFAATLANAFGDAYIQTVLDLKVEPAKRQNEWFEGQTLNLRKDVQAAQEKLSTAQREHGIVAADSQRLDLESARLAEISSQLVVVQAQVYDSQTRLRQMAQATVKKHLQELPDLLGNTLLQSMKSDVVKAGAKLAELSERYGKKHPQYQSAAAELASLRTKMEVEINNAIGSVRQAAEIDQHRAQELQKAMENQKQRIFNLKQQRDVLDVLTKEVENAQNAYDAASQRAGQVHLESQIDQSNIAVLNPAVPPLKPASPKTRLNLLLSLFLGTFLGTGFALLAELFDRRLRTTEDISEGLGLVVLGEIPVMSNP
ncbi:MAG: chain length determinant protein EpsF [Methylobacter sp.]|uniref:chain length determinant protein EpsF n=1 Tax=Methylobacter sp. TaxID=2051955 RepID=UPI0027302D4E|nr:chain length determinant protein EpsF [Methylobacter sp.]MDP1664550.1 chain length determinant protein EpsF [Methylobacter sp.]